MIELWLLGAGAVILVALALWIVWRAESADAASGEEHFRAKEETPMSLDRDRPAASDLAPQGERFEDQYTSATSDLSAAGVAAALGSVHDTLAGDEAPPVAAASTSEPRAALPAPPRYALPAPARNPLTEPRTIGIGAGALLTVGAVGGAWLFSRWQHERNKPINRLRRRARDVTSSLAERVPDMDNLPDSTAPVGGAAAVALTGLILVRALRGGSGSSTSIEADSSAAQDVKRKPIRDLSVQDILNVGRASRPRLDSLDDVADRLKDVRAAGGRAARRLPRPKDVPSVDARRVAKPAFLGLGVSGVVAVAAGSYVVWRLLGGGGDTTNVPSPGGR